MLMKFRLLNLQVAQILFKNSGSQPYSGGIAPVTFVSTQRRSRWMSASWGIGLPGHQAFRNGATADVAISPKRSIDETWSDRNRSWTLVFMVAASRGRRDSGRSALTLPKPAFRSTFSLLTGNAKNGGDIEAAVLLSQSRRRARR